MASATDADARRERGRMPAAASDQASNEEDASVPPSRFVTYPTVSSVTACPTAFSVTDCFAVGGEYVQLTK